MSSLVRGMSRLEEDLHKAQEEKASVLADLASVRELCVKLDSGKEFTARQLTAKSMDLERVRMFWTYFNTNLICFGRKLVAFHCAYLLFLQQWLSIFSFFFLLLLLRSQGN